MMTYFNSYVAFIFVLYKCIISNQSGSFLSLLSEISAFAFEQARKVSIVILLGQT